MRSLHFLRTCILAGITLAVAVQSASSAEPDQKTDARDTLLPLSSLTGDKALDALMERLEVRLSRALVWSDKVRPDQQDDLMFGALVGSEFRLIGGEVLRCRDVEVSGGLTNQDVSRISGVACRGRDGAWALFEGMTLRPRP